VFIFAFVLIIPFELFSFPIQRCFYNKVQVVVARFPAEYVSGLIGFGNEGRGVTGTAFFFLDLDWCSIDAVNGVNDFSYAVAVP